jgi:tRNA(Ile)-lysidine synthase
MNSSIELNSIETLKSGKNLLAFSGGVDSSALFFLLIEHKIEFDIALVNYQVRKESILEEDYAKSLAKEYNILAHTIKAPQFNSNFEKMARDFRYSYFEKLIEKFKYQNLITAHQLNDQLEWFLMRLTKGAGFVELIGFNKVSKREKYNIVRPILDISKDELLEYLNSKRYRYFIDKTNSDMKYERNLFREKFSNSLIKDYKDGILRSFQYLQKDKETLLSYYREFFNHKKLYVIEITDIRVKTRAIDIYLKKLGYLLSSAQRANIEQKSSLVIGGLWAIESMDKLLFIAPYIKTPMPKKFREECRVIKIPPKVRGYIYSEGILDKLKDRISIYLKLSIN